MVRARVPTRRLLDGWRLEERRRLNGVVHASDGHYVARCGASRGIPADPRQSRVRVTSYADWVTCKRCIHILRTTPRTSIFGMNGTW